MITERRYSPMYSPCATKGPWFRYTENGSIEVQDIGIQSYKSLPKRISIWKDLINQNASRWQIPPSIICAFMSQESAGHENAVSISDAYGLMQIIPSTGREWGKRYLGKNNITTKDLLDPAINVALGSAGLADSMRNNDYNIVKVAAIYNSGKTKCGEYCSTDKHTGERHCCPYNKWNLKTNCGYIDGIIKFNNTAIDFGYSGNLILIPYSGGWRAFAFVASAIAGGAAIGFAAKKGLFEGRSWRS